ncbi:protein-disulfide reductase DsbD domain-containing protein, partial [Corallococcus sp. 4LFB]|uniref:protein-disulfide reductase DsbD domain-containing protein n=1 Tax=Corallococcus sp. 4LFB TaxID=3383249 RepID=UPI00397547B5
MTHPWSKRSGSRLGGLGVVGALLVAAVAQAALPSTAVGSTAPDEGDPRLEGALLLDATQVKAGGDFRVGVRLRLDPDWHVYWKNPGDSGLATDVAWDAPGITVGDLRWPFPSTFRTPDGFITTHGYHDEVLLFAPAHVSDKATGTLTVSTAVDALACKVHCIPAQLVLSRTVPVGPETVLDAEFAPQFDAAQAQVPVPAGAEGAPRVALALDGTSLTAGKPFTGTLTVTTADGKPFAGNVEDDFFVPGRIAGVDSVTLKRKGPGTFALEGQASSVVPKSEPRLTGALRLGTKATGFTAVEVDTALAPVVAAAGAPVAGADPLKVPSVKDALGKVKPAVAAAPVAAEAPMGLGLALLFAFLGGALLNLMPCVFPVLAIKAYGFTRLVAEEKGKVAPHAAAYAGGILATMLLLAGAVLAVRAGGNSVGWGFQFQEPLFVAGVSAVVVAFALNLFGVYTLGTDGTALAGKVDQSHGLLRSAGEGVLAVVLATPCSAPLLGTAVGFAF